MRPVPNRETEPSEGAEESDPYEAATTVAPMSGAIAKLLLEAEREMQASPSASREREIERTPTVGEIERTPTVDTNGAASVGDGSGASRTSAPPVDAPARTLDAAAKTDALPALSYEDGEPEYEPTILNPVAPHLEMAAVREVSKSSADVVESVIREMEAAVSADDTAKTTPPIPRPTPRHPTEPLIHPGMSPDATAPMPAQPSPTLHDGAPETMSEGRLMTPRAPAPRAVFPEWIGVSVTADDLDPRKGDKGLRAVQVAVGVGVLSIAIGIVWWLLSLL